MKRSLFIQMNQNTPFAKKSFRQSGNKLVFFQKTDFDRFVKNLELLNAIQSTQPKSIYELAKTENKDTANINKIAAFYEKLGVIKMRSTSYGGRKLKTPQVQYDQIIFEVQKKIKIAPGKAVLGLVRRR